MRTNKVIAKMNRGEMAYGCMFTVPSSTLVELADERDSSSCRSTVSTARLHRRTWTTCVGSPTWRA